MTDLTGQVSSSWQQKANMPTTLSASLEAAAILTGANDDQLEVQKATAKPSGPREESQVSGLSETLAVRLRHSYRAIARDATLEPSNQGTLQCLTGDTALDLLVSIHQGLLEKKQDPSSRVATEKTRIRQPQGPPKPVEPKEDVGLGVKDIKLAKTLQSLAAKWALVPRILAYDQALSNLLPRMFAKKETARPLDQASRFEEIVEEDSEAKRKKASAFFEARRALFQPLQKWASIVGASSEGSFSASTQVASLFLQIGVVDFLAALLRLAFGPGPSAGAAGRDQIYQSSASWVNLLLKFLSIGSVISSVLSSSTWLPNLGLPSFVKSASSRLLSAQLLRPDGVRALLIVTLGGSDVDEDGFKDTLPKSEHLARLLGTPPQGMPVEVYMPLVIPRLIDVIDPDPKTTVTAPSPSHMRAAAFTLTRISEKQPTFFAKALETRVYSHFNPQPAATWVVVDGNTLARAVLVLSAFLLFSEPSPAFFDSLLSPVLPQLLSLHCYLSSSSNRSGKSKVRQTRLDDDIDTMRDQVDALLRAWTRLVEAKEGSATLMLAIMRAERGIGSDFTSTDDEQNLFWAEERGEICIKYGLPPERSIDTEKLMDSLSLSDLAAAIGSSDQQIKLPDNLSSAFGIRPDPKIVLGLLQKTNRKDLAKSFLPRILDAYMGQKNRKKAALNHSEDTEARLVLFLHLILQLFEAFGSELLEGEIATTLTFINFSLSSPTQRRVEQPIQPREEDGDIPVIRAGSIKTESLFNVASKAEKSPKEHDIEDEEDAEDDEELIIISLTLLLSLLEGNTSLSTDTTPLLLVISSKIERHLDSENEEIRSLSKEARLVLTARRNASRGPRPASATSTLSEQALGFTKAHETYQEALQLLQDPILPVRAHGLILLRSLVSGDLKNGGQRQHLDLALLPAILDIFIQAVQDEESYLYLNAVQGLSAMGASGGKNMLASLVTTYVGKEDLASKNITKREVDKRLRVGEALLQVIQKCGDALGPNISVLVPPLLTKLRDSTCPTTLRTSIISILGTTIEAVPIALASNRLAAEMALACIDLVAVETVQRPDPVRQKVSIKVSGSRGVQDVDSDEEQVQQPDSATSTDSKLAQLRRAALLLLALLLRGTRHQIIDHDVPGREDEKLDALRLPGGGSLPSIDGGRAVTRSSLKRSDLLFPLDLLARLEQVVTMSHSQDTDALVRLQAQDCLSEASFLSQALVPL